MYMHACTCVHGSGLHSYVWVCMFVCTHRHDCMYIWHMIVCVCVSVCLCVCVCVCVCVFVFLLMEVSAYALGPIWSQVQEERERAREREREKDHLFQPHPSLCVPKIPVTIRYWKKKRGMRFCTWPKHTAVDGPAIFIFRNEVTEDVEFAKYVFDKSAKL